MDILILGDCGGVDLSCFQKDQTKEIAFFFKKKKAIN